MSARRRQVDLGLARGRRLVVDLCRELDEARRSLGLSYEELGRAVGLSGDQVGRICRAESPGIGLVRLAALLAAVGLELSARAFPAGPPIRDAAHIALLARLRARLSPALGWHVEVPVVAIAGPLGPGVRRDMRAWDAVIDGKGWSVGVEAETRLGDLQALSRRIALKRRDGNVDVVVLLVNETTHNRRLLALEGVDIATEFTGTTRNTLRCLGEATRPRADALIVL
jgi:transcriptional regulator with XRE-family HTH domain